MSEALNSQTGVVGDAVVVMNVTKRDGRQVSFDERLISKAMQRAFCADLNLKDMTDLSSTQQSQIAEMTRNVIATAKPL